MSAVSPVYNTTAFETDDPTKANFIFYNYGDGNWCGIGTDNSGRAHIRFGTANSARLDYLFNSDGIYLNNDKITGKIADDVDTKNLELEREVEYPVNWVSDKTTGKRYFAVNIDGRYYPVAEF